MPFPHVPQREVMDCGPTCLKIIAKYYGKDYQIEILRQLSHTDRSGSNFVGLSIAAEAVGLRSLAVKVNFKKLETEAPFPAIVHWQQNHFAVIYRISKTKVYISDPATGLTSYTHREFIRHWIGLDSDKDTNEGIALLLEPTNAFYEKEIKDDGKEKTTIISMLVHYTKPHRKLMFQVILSLLAGSFLTLLFPFLTQNIIDIGILNKNLNIIWLILLGQLMLTLGQVSLEIVRSWLLLHVSKRMSIALISDFFVKLMKLPMRYFDSKLTGDLMQRISDHHRIQTFLTNTTLTTVFSLFNTVLYSIILIYYSFTLFLIFTVSTAAYLAWISFFLKRRKNIDYKRFHQTAETNSKIFELINGMQELKLHNAERQKRWEWERIQVKLYKISIEALSLEQAQGIGSRIIHEFKNIFITIVAATLVIEGELSLGMMLAISYIIGQLNGPILQLVNLVRDWQDAHISLNRISEIHNKEDETTIPSAGNYEFVNTNLKVPENHNIKLEGVSFRYNELSDDVIEGITLEIPSNKVTAIVGASGSGKTTLLKLLTRFYKPTSGKIYVNDIELSQLDIYDWREQCGIVMQESFLFNNTIANNIAVGEDSPDLDQLNHAITLANIYDFVNSLPRGLNTKIGVEGLGISTGQRQRILIARAIYKNPRIIFFDEATSSLDAINEKEIMRNLKDFYKNKTAVIIAHRLSTVRDADKIIVLDNGKVVEEGDHQSLIARDGFYFNLVKNQLELGIQ